MLLEAWSNKRPDISHMREIGCDVYVFVQGGNPKIAPRSMKCTLISYRQSSPTYRYLHWKTGKIVKLYHVKFIKQKDKNERESPLKTATSTPPITLIDQTKNDPVEDTNNLPHTHKNYNEQPANNKPPENNKPTANNKPPQNAPKPCQSMCQSKPSSILAESKGIPYQSQVQRAVAESNEAAAWKQMECSAKQTAVENNTESNTMPADNKETNLTAEAFHNYIKNEENADLQFPDDLATVKEVLE